MSKKPRPRRQAKAAVLEQERPQIWGTEYSVPHMEDEFTLGVSKQTGQSTIPLRLFQFSYGMTGNNK